MFDSYLLSRLLSSFFVGSMISLNGSYAQVLTQNPLAAPSTLGIQALALLLYLLGFTIGKILGINDFLSISLVLFHIVFILLIFSYRSPRPGLMKKLVLFGICLNLLVASLYSLVQFILLNIGIQFPGELWFGNFRYASMEQAFFVGICFLVSLLFTLKYGKRLRVYVLGRDFAQSYLKDPEKIEKNIFLLMTYTMCMSTFLFGYFSFLGLLFPHILRLFRTFSKDIVHELLGGAFLGGLFFMLIDGACYEFLVNGAELPIGMVTAVLGPLVFLLIVIFKRDSIKNLY